MRVFGETILRSLKSEAPEFLTLEDIVGLDRKLDHLRNAKRSVN
jgi:hypothetical protein